MRTTYLKLPFQFDEKKLVDDLSLILDEKWISHFNTAGYQGDWKVIPLYAKGGDDAHIFALSTSKSAISETSILKKCPYLKEVITTFKCPILSARILKLGVGSEIKPHKDHELGYENNNFRIHIPIKTNANVQFILDETALKMLPGECWYTNVNYTHSVKNLGKTARLHLVIDFERNEWSDKLFFSLAPKESFLPPPEEEYSPETLKLIIEQLKLSTEPAAQQLIANLTTKLKKLNN